MDSTEKWNLFFDRQITVELQSSSDQNLCVNKFNVYLAGNVHDNLLICLHGAGHTALSWSLVAKALKENFCVAAYDCRGHGLTECADPLDLRTELLVDDGIKIIDKLQCIIQDERKVREKEKKPCAPSMYSNISQSELLVREKILAESRHQGPPTLLMGHSMGGAMAIHMAYTGKVKNLQGLIVLDVVEGTVFEAFPRMDQFISLFPTSFASVKEAVDWSLQHILRNPESASISIPSQLKWEGTEWRWRVDLKATKPFWNEWFFGIGDKFLSTVIPSGGKVLVLVGHERLDKPLTIAQMQGKFNLIVIPKSGHIVQEDQPCDVVKVVLEFAERYCLL